MREPASTIVARLREAFDADHALALLRRAIATPSVTGEEAAFAGLLKDELIAIGAEGVALREFEPGRPNVWGRRDGRAGADTLLIVGHTDTVHVRGWRERWAGSEREDPFGGALVDGAVWGRGASDLKAGICAALEAVRTLDRAGAPLDPNVMFAFVGDEESGEAGSGVSAGACAFAGLIAEGEVPKPDIAIYVEPTMLDVYVAHMGFIICDVAVIGKSAYFGVPELGVDALKAAHPALDALWRYSDELARGLSHPLVGAGFVLPTGVQAGGYIAVPGECAISLIAKVPPGVPLDRVREGLEAAVRSAIADSRVQVRFSYPARRDHPVGGQPFEQAWDPARLERLISAVRAIRPDRGKIEAAPYWSELPIFAALGVPGVYFAPGDIRICHTAEENVALEDYYDGILALALFLAGPDRS
ncbi:MAG: M20/M25/M40 family metallo-hydrolase [Hyphomicrobiales bacterium]|nr:M20/M25/M40 family metallo-hydrolase [Hyphomicrobiales bacterium]